MIVRRAVGVILVLASTVCLLLALGLFADLCQSAGDFGRHHEVTVPLSLFLAYVALALALCLTGVRLAFPQEDRDPFEPLLGFGLVAAVAWITSLIFVNETFFSLLEPKGFPVHLTEPVVFPGAGWHGLTAHLLAALATTAGLAFYWWTVRPRRAVNGDGDTN